MAEFRTAPAVHTIIDREPALGIVCVDPTSNPDDLTIVARQVSYFMRNIQMGVYMAPPEEGGLGLRSLDPEVPANPDNEKEIAGRVARFRQSTGPYVMDGRAIWCAIELDPDTAAPRADLGALAGIVILSRFKPIIKSREWQPPYVEIEEWDVRQDLRDQHVGSALLRAGLAYVSSQSRLVLDVAEGNAPAIKIYRHLSFEANGGRAHHGVFDTAHMQMVSSHRRVTAVMEQNPAA